MENSSYALVLTGTVLPSHTPEAVWPVLAAYFRMDVDKLSKQLLARAPLTIKQGDDLGKLQTLLEGVAAAGAEAEICAPDGRPGMFVMLDNMPRGPVPRVLVDERVEYGQWAASTMVAEVGSSAWKPYSDFVKPVVAPVAPSPAPVAAPDPFTARDVATRVSTPSTHFSVAGGATGSIALPAGAAIGAGFWRRCAAMLLDGVVIGVISWVVSALGMTMLASGGSTSAIVAGSFGMSLLMVIVDWLYFALQESSAAQATLGKRAMGIKVTDDYGRRIGFGRASGRFFGKIISGLILYIGFMLAGWTARKQALHDMIAGTMVVFRGVESGQPLPTDRPPMPWYGWLVNGLVVGGFLLTAIVFVFYAGVLIDLVRNGLQGGS
ncbi:MAG: RDD family protein [Dokdonella sp.]